MARNTKIQLRRGTASVWTSSGATLAEGEIGYEIDTGRFKIGKIGGSLWSALPYAGGFDIVQGTGVSTLFDSANNSYTISSVVESSGNGLSVQRLIFNGNGVSSPTGSYYSIGLSNRLQALSNLSSSGIIVGTNSSGVTTRTLAQGNNITISNADGINGDPTISLNSSITGITTLTAGTLNSTNNYSDNIYVDNIYPRNTNTVVLNANSVVATGNFKVNGNLVIEGDTITQNVSSIQVEDPTLRLGNTTGVLSNTDVMDRGIEFVYRRTGTIPITGFFGYDHSADAFVFLKDATNTSETYTGTAGSVNVGGLYSSAGISGTVITSTVSSPTAPMVVSSTGQVDNLNADLLDGQHGSYYRNWTSITGLSTPTYTVTLTGDISGTATSSATTLGNNVSLSINTTLNGLSLNNVALGSGTTGQYAKTIVVAGTGLSITPANADDGTDYTVTSNATPSNITGTLIARNSTDGGFSAGAITAVGFVGYGGAITGLYADNLSSGTIPSERLTGNYNINVLGSAGSTTGVLSFSSTGNGNTDSFNGSVNKIVSYNSVGAPSNTGASASGNSWNIGILGNAATSTNATNASGIYISAITSNDTLTSLVLVGNQTSTSQQPFIDSGLSYNANTDTLNVYNISGLNTDSIYGSTSISGTLGSVGNPQAYLYNFVIDGGSP